MFLRSTLYSYIFALGLVLTANAVVQPDTPGPGVTFLEGGNCLVTWIGDTESPSDWGSMSIELMTGDNFNMVHITTVATDQDGTSDGKFQFTCPDVEPNSAIYFFQFSSPASEIKTWTTRFTIAAANGTTVPPEHDTQPGTGDNIPWGVGALEDPSTATPPPDIGTGDGSASDETSASPSTTKSTDVSKSSSTPSLPGSGIETGGVEKNDDNKDDGASASSAGAGAGTGIASPNSPPSTDDTSSTRPNSDPPTATSNINSNKNANGASTAYGESSVWNLSILGFIVLLRGNML